MSLVGLDLDLQLLENILGQLDIKISELRDALRGTGNKTLTDLYNRAYDSVNDRIKIDAQKVADPPSLDVNLSTRASEETLGYIKNQTDKLSFDASNYLQVNVKATVNPSNLNVPFTNFVGSPGSPPPSQGLVLLGYDGSNMQRLKVDSDGELQVDISSLPKLPSGDNIIGGFFAANLLDKILDGVTVGTTEVVSDPADVRRYGRKVIYINNSQNVDITVDIDVSYDGSDWYTIRSGISVPAGSKKIGILRDTHAYVRARAVASSAPTSGSVTVAVFSMM